MRKRLRDDTSADCRALVLHAQASPGRIEAEAADQLADDFVFPVNPNAKPAHKCWRYIRRLGPNHKCRSAGKTHICVAPLRDGEMPFFE